jgi:hypothetical protein
MIHEVALHVGCSVLSVLGPFWNCVRCSHKINREQSLSPPHNINTVHHNKNNKTSKHEALPFIFTALVCSVVAVDDDDATTLQAPQAQRAQDIRPG